MKLALLLVAAVLPQAPAPQQPSVALPPELDRVLRDYEQGWAKGDGKSLAALFTDDGFVMQPNRLPVKGREEIAKLYQREGSPLFLRAFAYAMDGSVAYILGGYTYERGADDHGKFTLTLRKTGSRWLIASDMDSGNHPRR